MITIHITIIILVGNNIFLKEWKRCDDKQGYRTCFTKYNQGNFDNHDVGNDDDDDGEI